MKICHLTSRVIPRLLREVALGVVVIGYSAHYLSVGVILRYLRRIATTIELILDTQKESATRSIAIWHILDVTNGETLNIAI